MGRRQKKESVWLEIIPQAVGVLLLRQRHHHCSDRSNRFHSSKSLQKAMNLVQSATTDALPAREPETQANLIQQLRTIDWFQFEKLVELVYRRLDYSVTRKGGANPDGGIDLVIEKDGVKAAIQCKQWKTWNVGVKAVREFLGALTDAGIRSGIFITLNGYSAEAKALVEKHGIQIINETGLAEMLKILNAATDPDVLKVLSDNRKFCPKCESEMVLRTASKGINAGHQFWGCSRYPKCRFTMQCS
jgi:restriction endonuclease Mrr